MKITCATQTRALGIWGAFALACGCASDVRAQAATPDENLIDRGQLESVLDFEATPRGNQPGGWGGGPAGTIFADETVVHGGKRSARLERTANGLIIGIRGYPAEFMVWTLGPLLIDKETAFSRNTKASLSNPGAFYWNQPLVMQPLEPHYPGRVAILVDENSISQSEFTTMAFRASPRVIVVGSTTAGADGNISPFSLPGGLHTQISGNGTFYPDKTPTQRVGIIPDLVVRPSVAGIRAGRDEVLDAAMRQILHEYRSGGRGVH